MKLRFTLYSPVMAFGLLAMFAGSTALAETIDASSPDGFVQISRKIQCSLKDEEPVTYTWAGRAYARVPGERDKHVFNLEGMNVRQCISVEDDKRGTGFRLVSREIMLYLDPKTNEVLRTWENPWTGASNEVIHVANDPVNGRPTFGRDADGNPSVRPLKEINGTWFMNFEVPLFYTNPLAGDYQKYVGGTYHATEIFDFSGDLEELLDAEQAITHPTVAWVRIAKWLPWMEMGDRVGILYFNAVGKKLESWDQLSDVMKTEIAASYPDYTAPPPVSDTRPNETSWTYMKKIIDSRPKEEPKSRH